MKQKTALGAFSAIALIAMVFGYGCTKNNTYYGPDGQQRILLSSQVDLGLQQRLQDLQIAEGRALSLFVTDTGETDEVLYDNQEIMANGAGGFTYSQTMYYPANGGHVDFYAVHPYDEDASLGQPLSFTIQADQSQEAGYLNSDMLYATRGNVAPTSSAVSMLFSHKMAKLDFVIKQGEGADIMLLNDITVLGIAPTTTINLSTGTLGNATGTPIEVTAYGVTAQEGPVNQISGITAIVTPQSFPIGTRLFRIRIGTNDYIYTSTQAITFQSGSRYTLELTINQTSIELESSINPWTDGGSITGEGSID